MAVRSIQRRELHALIWSKPMRDAAAQLGMSDVGLKKACIRHNIPVPPQGYWNRIAAGHAPKIAPLTAGGPRSIYLNLSDPGLELPDGDYDELQRIIEWEATPEAHVELGSLDRLCAPARHLRQVLLRAKPDDYGAVICEERTLPRVRVAPSSVDRVALLVDALITLFHVRGWSFGAPADRPWATMGHLTAGSFSREATIEEPFTRKTHLLTAEEAEARKRGRWVSVPTYDYVPSGNLILKIAGTMVVRDTEKRLVEEHLNDVAIWVARASFEAREDKRREELRAQKLARYEARRAEIERLKKAVSAAGERLESQAKAHEQAERIRAFVEAAKRTPATPERDRWVEWATSYARHLDPLTKGGASFSVPDADAAALVRLEEKGAEDF